MSGVARLFKVEEHTKNKGMRIKPQCFWANTVAANDLNRNISGFVVTQWK